MVPRGPSPRRLALLVLLAAPLAAAAAPAYVAHELVGPEGRRISASAINNLGVLVGITGSGNHHVVHKGVVGDGTTNETFVWPHGRTTAPLAINDAGVIVGYSQDERHHEHAWVRRDGQDTELEPGQAHVEAIGVNASGTVLVVGGGVSALFYGDSAIRLTGFHEPVALNDAGVVIGEAYPPTGVFPPHQAVRWIDGALDFLPYLDGQGGIDGSAATGINTRGDIVGWCSTGDNVERGCLWHDGLVEDIGMLPGNFDARPAAINTARTIVGNSTTGTPQHAESHAFVKFDGAPMRDLNDLAPVPGVTLQDAYFINDQGQILATGRDAVGQRHYRLDPIAAR